MIKHKKKKKEKSSSINTRQGKTTQGKTGHNNKRRGEAR
jgi:hypothetical protein